MRRATSTSPSRSRRCVATGKSRRRPPSPNGSTSEFSPCTPSPPTTTTTSGTTSTSTTVTTSTAATPTTTAATSSRLDAPPALRRPRLGRVEHRRRRHHVDEHVDDAAGDQHHPRAAPARRRSPAFVSIDLPPRSAAGRPPGHDGARRTARNGSRTVQKAKGRLDASICTRRQRQKTRKRLQQSAKRSRGTAIG